MYFYRYNVFRQILAKHYDKSFGQKTKAIFQELLSSPMIFLTLATTVGIGVTLAYRLSIDHDDVPRKYQAKTRVYRPGSIRAERSLHPSCLDV